LCHKIISDMLGFSYLFFVNFFLFVQNLFSSMDPAYMDVLKIFAGSIGWIGSLTLFMWYREKRKLAFAKSR